MANKSGARKMTVQDYAEQAARDAANAAGETRREKEKAERQRNNEKQKRFRESMKAEGFKQVLLWAFPCPADVRERMAAAGFRQVPAWESERPRAGETRQEKRRGDPGMVKVAAAIRESSLGVADRAPEVRAALSRAMSEFLSGVGESPEGKAVYADYVELLKPLGDPWGGSGV